MLCFKEVKSYHQGSVWSQWLLPTLSAAIYNKCHGKVSAFGGIFLESLTASLLFWKSKLTVNACPGYVALQVVAEITHPGKGNHPGNYQRMWHGLFSVMAKGVFSKMQCVLCSLIPFVLLKLIFVVFHSYLFNYSFWMSWRMIQYCKIKPIKHVSNAKYQSWKIWPLQISENLSSLYINILQNKYHTINNSIAWINLKMFA